LRRAARFVSRVASSPKLQAWPETRVLADG
jgi:hypothetical protein